MGYLLPTRQGRLRLMRLLKETANAGAHVLDTILVELTQHCTQALDRKIDVKDELPVVVDTVQYDPFPTDDGFQALVLAVAPAPRSKLRLVDGSYPLESGSPWAHSTGSS